MVADSFKSCALNFPTDGFQDNIINCLKSQQPCEAGEKMLREQMALLQDPFANQNPFENITDSDIEDAHDPINLIDSDHDSDNGQLRVD